ncbi:MAG: hypothetical protein IJW29_04830 [Clostridia bacterium]|nr:hypothetical protein [Clostridia bacterium]
MENYIKEERGGVRVQALLCDRTVVNEVGADFSLPDYQPEIKRLLRVRASVSPPDKYIGAGSAELSGTVDYSILYAGNDGALYCANQAEEYRVTVPVEMTADFEIGDGVVCDVEMVPDMTVGRVMGPRRMSLKCRLRSRVRMYGTRVIEEEIRGATEDALERLRGSCESARVFVGVGDPIRLGDEIVCDTQAEGLRVICAEGQVLVSEAVAGSGCVNCRGEAVLKLLCCREGSGEAPYVQWRRIPFAGSVPVDGAEVNCDCCAHGACTDVSITVEEGRILCEVALRLSARAQRNESISYTKDLYSTAQHGENAYDTVALPVARRCINGNFSLNTTLSMEEAGIRPEQSVVDLILTPTVQSLACENGKYVLVGKCRALATLYAAGELSAQEFDVPFRYETEGDCDASDYDVTVTPLSSRARADGERVGVDAELGVALATRAESEVMMLRAASLGDAVTPIDATYTVCYPAREDSLWSVAKRYHKPVADIAQKNPLSGSPAADSADSLDGVRYLLI